MINKKRKIFILIIIIAVAVILYLVFKGDNNRPETMREINPVIGNITDIINTTGTVKPKNRLEIIPEIPGRIEKILVSEGDKIKAGQILAWMSSSERAALIDAARSQGEKSVKYWEEAYKPIPIIAPIGGTVIVRSIEPGQSVNTSSAIFVLSDRLMVEAVVDETDIGRVKAGQRAVISLDAYPDVRAEGQVDSISFESETVNNVTTYKVDIVPDKVPPVFRSGMSANIDIIEKQKNNALMLPIEAVITAGDRSFIMIKKDGNLIRKPVITGISNGRNIEIVSGLAQEEKVFIVSAAYLPKESNRRNLFGPPRRPRSGKKTEK